MSTSYRFPKAERCVNCGWNMLGKISKESSSKLFKVRAGELPDAERELLASWLPKIEDFDRRPVCKDCEVILWRLATAPRPVERKLAHATCAACGATIGRNKRCVRLGPKNEEFLRQFIQEYQVDKKLCHACHNAVYAVERQNSVKKQNSFSTVMVKDTNIDPNDSMVTEDEAENLSDAIVLRNKTITLSPELSVSKVEVASSFPLNGYSKVCEKKSKVCVTCAEAGVRRLNLPTRQKLLLRHKLYVSTSAKVCEKHRVADNWPTNEDAAPNEFTSEEIADVLFLLKGIWPVDFGNIENLHHHVLKSWTGLTLEEFEELYQQKPVLHESPSGRFALAVWLASKHTRECVTVLASLTQRSRGMVAAALKMVNECHQPQTRSKASASS